MSTYDKASVELGSSVRSLRAARGWTQADLAALLTEAGRTMSQTVVSRIETGSRFTGVCDRAALARVFGTTSSDLLGPVAPAGDDRGEATLARREREQTQTAATEFGEVVRKRRTANGWTQTELGERMNDYGLRMSKQVVAGLENGKRPTSMDELLALARVFGTSITRLVEPVDLAFGIRPLSVEATTVMDEATLDLICDQVAARIAAATIRETT